MKCYFHITFTTNHKLWDVINGKTNNFSDRFKLELKAINHL